LGIALETVSTILVALTAQHRFGNVAERWMPKIVGKSGRLGSIRVHLHPLLEESLVRGIPLEILSKPPSKLSNLQGMRQPVVEELHLVGTDDLRDASETAERARVQDAVSVVLGRRSVVGRHLCLESC
jgi:hypothetical protein